MSTVAVMQPYLFPYIGYYQLVAAADTFVFLDDVNFIKRGFINRNWVVDRTGRPVPFRIPVKGASQNRHINEHVYGAPGPKPLKTLHQCYAGVSGFEEICSIFDQVMSKAEGNSVAKISALSIVLVAEHLELGTNFVTASDIDPHPSQRGQERILSLCQRLGASRYLNLPSGRKLYDPEKFRARGVSLEFVQPKTPSAQIVNGEHVHVSVLHYLLSAPNKTRRLLTSYEHLCSLKASSSD